MDFDFLSKITDTVSNAAEIVATTKGSCVDIESEKEFEGFENDFQEVCKGLSENYAALKRKCNMLKGNEKTVDRVFQPILDSKVASHVLLKNIKSEINKGFKTSPENFQISNKISEIQNFFRQFTETTKMLDRYPKHIRVSALERAGGVLENLQNEVAPGGDLYKNIRYFVLQSPKFLETAESSFHFSVCHLLYIGALMYVLVFSFLLEEYSLLVDFYYKEGIFKKFNEYIDWLVITFNELRFTLLCETALLQSIMDIITKVHDLPSSENQRDSLSKLQNWLVRLNSIKNLVQKTNLPVISDQPPVITKRLDFETSNVRTPIGRWESGVKVCYAIQFKENTNYSKIGEWSEPMLVHEKANPILNVPTNSENRTRLIFRRFDYEKPQLVGVIEEACEDSFRDINRDVYNIASRMNEALAIDEIKVLIENGADVNSVFENGRRAIHAAAQMGNSKLASQFLISGDSTINFRDNYGYTPLHIAAKAGYQNFVELLVEHGADPNACTDTEELTALHLAVLRGNNSAMKILVNKDSTDLNLSDKDGFTPLHLAVLKGCTTVQTLMSNERVDINAPSKQGLTPLHLAVLNNLQDISKILNDREDLNINKPSLGNFTALHFAALTGNTEIVKILTSVDFASTATHKLNAHHLNVNARSLGSFTALHFAAMSSNVEIVRMLCSIGFTNANLTFINIWTRLHVEINARCKYNLTALHMATISGNVDIVRFLATIVCTNVNAASLSEWTALHFAVATGRLAVVSALLDVPGINPNSRDLENWTPLHLASKMGGPKTVDLLCRKGATVDQRTVRGLTPLHLAAQYGHNQIVTVLVKYGANIQSESTDGYTALLIAAESKQSSADIIEYLWENMEIQNNIAASNIYVTKNGKRRRLENVSPLHLAAKSGNLEIVSMLCTKGATPNERTKEGLTPLHLAAQYGHHQVMEILLEHGVDIEAETTDGYTALLTSAASKESNTDVIKWLLKNGAKKNALNENGDDFKTLVFKRGSLQVVQYVLENYGCSVNNSIENSALHFAASGNDLAVLQYLVDEWGFEVNILNRNKETPLFLAMKNTNLGIIPYLISEGCFGIKDHTPLYSAVVADNLNVVKFLIEKGHGDPNFKEGNGNTALHAAAQFSSLPLVKFLVEFGCDVNAKDNNDSTPLTWALNEEKWDNAKFLVKKGSVLNGEEADLNKILLAAAKSGKLDMVKFLVEHGADIKYNNKKTTPLHEACFEGYLPVVKYLVENGADVTAKDIVFQTPIIRAIEGSNIDVLKYFVEECDDIRKNFNLRLPLYNAVLCENLALVKYFIEMEVGNIEEVSSDKWTPLHCACHSGYFTIVKYLIEKGANIHAKERNGWTPLHIAACNNHLSIVIYLVEKHVNVNATNNFNEIPLRLAEKNNHSNVIAYLKSLK